MHIVKRILLLVSLCLVFPNAGVLCTNKAYAATKNASQKISVYFYDTVNVKEHSQDEILSSMAKVSNAKINLVTLRLAENRIKEAFRNTPRFAQGFRIQTIQFDDVIPDSPYIRCYVHITRIHRP